VATLAALEASIVVVPSTVALCMDVRAVVRRRRTYALHQLGNRAPAVAHNRRERLALGCRPLLCAAQCLEPPAGAAITSAA
jgi:hypothetical protein